MKNEFILYLRHHDLKEKEKIFKDLLNDDEFQAYPVGEKIFKKRKEVFYRLKISPSGLIKLKKILDNATDYDCLELFEFREW